VRSTRGGRSPRRRAAAVSLEAIARATALRASGNRGEVKSFSCGTLRIDAIGRARNRRGRVGNAGRVRLLGDRLHQQHERPSGAHLRFVRAVRRLHASQPLEDARERRTRGRLPERDRPNPCPPPKLRNDYGGGEGPADEKAYRWWRPPSTGIAVSSRDVPARPGASQRAPVGGWMRRLRCGRPWV
jgi:hypothetical protein